MDRLKGKVILISGGARGQGAAEARLFVAEGARVVIGDVLEPEGRQLGSELGNAAVFVRQDDARKGLGNGGKCGREARRPAWSGK